MLMTQATSELTLSSSRPTSGLTPSPRRSTSTHSRSRRREQRLDAHLQQSPLWVNYLGHGGLDRMSHEGLLTTGDVADLAPTASLPIVTALTCSVGRFEIPGWSSLGEALVLGEGRGAVAVWAPTGLSIHDAATGMNRDFAQALFGAEAQTLGAAMHHALTEFQTSNSLPHLPLIYKPPR